MTNENDPAMRVVEQAQLEGPRPPASTARKSKAKSVTREIIETVLLTLVVFLLLRLFVHNYMVDGFSMQPNFQDRERLWVNKAVYFHVDINRLKRAFGENAPGKHEVYLFHAPRRGEVIVFHFPGNSHRDLIKRVIGVPGDTVEVRDGTVFVNGSGLKEPYILETPNYTMPPVTIPPGKLFVLGDNRRNSSDSHAWGLLPMDNVVGKAWLTYWPLKDWGLVPAVKYSP